MQLGKLLSIGMIENCLNVVQAVKIIVINNDIYR